MDGITFCEIVLNSFKNYVDYANSLHTNKQGNGKVQVISIYVLVERKVWKTRRS